MPKSYSVNSKHKKRSVNKSRLLMASGTLLVAVVIIAGLELTNTTFIFHSKPTPAVIPTSSPSKQSSSNSNYDNNGNKNNQKASIPSAKTGATTGSQPSSSSGIALTAPYGVFVSNHHPGQNGSPTAEDSICNSTSGASCYIKFTKTSGETTKLPSQVVGTDGSTAWRWDANILPSGSWTVTAIATLNGQTKSTLDPIKLVVE